jgi:hypothetical protein
VGIPPERRDLLKILPAELIEALRQPLPIEERRALIRSLISDEILRVQALRYVEELRRAGRGDDPPGEE